MTISSEPRPERSRLGALLAPESIAIIGASANLSKLSGRPLKFLLEKGYSGRIYPVNPKYPEIAGVRCYSSIEALPAAVDLAIVAVPVEHAIVAVRELGARGVKSAVVFTSGFREAGSAGAAAENELVAAARAAGMRLCGPNCLGLINAFDSVIATFGQYADGATAPGPVAFVTQSGAFGTAIAALARRRGIGLGYFVNTGNEADVDFVQVMHEVLADPRIKLGAGYLEGVKDGSGLMRLAQHALELGKPIVVAKVGKTSAGARAAASHTGSLAGEDVVFDGVIRGSGIIRARNEEQMLDFVEVLTACAPAHGRGIGIVTQSGGAGVLMADRAEELGLTVAELSRETRDALTRVMPAFGTTSNPVDITGQFVSEPALLQESVRIVLSDPAVHVGIVWLQLMDSHVATLVAIFDAIKREATKPWVVCWVAAPEDALKALRERGIPALRGGEPAVDAVAALVKYSEARGFHERYGNQRPLAAPTLRREMRPGVQSSIETRQLLEAFDITSVATTLATTSDYAVAAAQALGYPVVLKVESRDIPHKTEADAVKIGLASDDDVRAAYAAMMKSARRFRADAAIDGVLVQRMAAGDVEVVIGLKNDPVFGAVVMVGFGGTVLEVIRDVTFRKAPVTPDEADRMLDDLKARALLGPFRGRAAIDRPALARMISAVSRFGVSFGPALQELDLNPVICSESNVIAVDWLLVVG